MNESRKIINNTAALVVLVVTTLDLGLSFALYAFSFIVLLFGFMKQLGNLSLTQIAIPFALVLTIIRFFFIRWLITAPPMFAMIKGKGLIITIALTVGLLEFFATYLVKIPLPQALFFSIFGFLFTLYFLISRK